MIGQTGSIPPLVAIIGEAVTVVDEPRLTITLYNADSILLLDVTTDPGTEAAVHRRIPVAVDPLPIQAKEATR